MNDNYFYIVVLTAAGQARRSESEEHTLENMVYQYHSISYPGQLAKSYPGQLAKSCSGQLAKAHDENIFPRKNPAEFA